MCIGSATSCFFFQALHHLTVHLPIANKTMVQVDYVNVGKDVYLIEVPESLKGFVPGNYELQSTKKVIRMFFPSCI